MKEHSFYIRVDCKDEKDVEDAKLELQRSFGVVKKMSMGKLKLSLINDLTKGEISQ